MNETKEWENKSISLKRLTFDLVAHKVSQQVSIPKELVVERIDPVVKLFEWIVGNRCQALRRSCQIVRVRKVEIARFEELLHGIDGRQLAFGHLWVVGLAFLELQERYITHHKHFLATDFANQIAILHGQ